MAERKKAVAEGNGDKQRGRAVFLIPNLFTALALMLGFYAVIKAIEGDYELAGWAIIFAAVMDMLDGRVARLINAQSEFGAQFDSLCDVVCFGLAAAVLGYQWGLFEFGRFGFAVAFFFCAAAAVRLARFNVELGSADYRFFSGLPTPMAGITLAALVLVIGREPNLGQIMLVMAFATAIAAAMISDFRYYSFKDIDVRARVNTPATLLLSLGIFALGVLILLEFGATAVLLVCLAYLLSGFVISSRYFLRKLRGGRKKLLAWLKKSKLADFFGKSDS